MKQISKNNIAKKLLLKLKKEDQNLVLRLDNKKSDLAKISRKHKVKLKKIIKEIGWPTIPKVGKEASCAAWLIVQHADHDVKFQESCLSLMKSLPEGDVLKKQIAYLTDRIMVNKGKKQIYGTQFYLNKKNVFGPRPIKDLKNIEKRWQEMEMSSKSWETFSDYKDCLIKKYQKDFKK